MFSVVSALARRAPETTTSRARRTTNFRIAQLPEFLVANNRWGYQPLVLLHPAMETEPCQDERFFSTWRELQPFFPALRVPCDGREARNGRALGPSSECQHCRGRATL